MFLNNNDIKDLTGYKNPKKQIVWLRQEGFNFRVGADGRPRVLKKEVESQMTNHVKVSESHKVLNREAIRKWGEKD